MKRLSALMVSVAAFAAVPALAEDIKPAVVYDLGGKNDKSFNESVANGVAQFTKSTGIKVGEFEPQQKVQVEQAIRNFARRGNSPILGVGFDMADPIKAVAKEFPAIKFAIIDGVVDAPNVQSIVFKENEGSYLAGALAGLTTKTGTIGFVGGMDIPLIRKFLCGYKLGAAAVKPDVKVSFNMVGSTPAAWNDPIKGAELAKSQIQGGADIVYQAAGGSGLGVLQAAADAGKLGIGVDANQNYLHSGKVLTSMLKRVDVAAIDTFTAAQKGTWKPGFNVLGLKENGVGIAFDEHNAKLVSPEAKAKIEALRADIVSGKITVVDYMKDNSCPL